MKINKIFLIIIAILMIVPKNVFATPGNLKKDSIISCNGNLYGKHGDGHWHQAQQNANGSYSAIGEALSSNPCNSELQPTTVTTKNTVPITTRANTTTRVSTTTKATTTAQNSSTTSSTTTVTTTTLTTRGTTEPVTTTISDDMLIKVIVNNREINFDKFKANVSIGSGEELNIEYELLSESLTTDLDYNKSINPGETAIIRFNVISNDGKKQEYEIEVYKFTTTEEVISVAVFTSATGGLGYGMYKLIKRKK